MSGSFGNVCVQCSLAPRASREREREIPRSVDGFQCDLAVEGEVKWDMVKSGLALRGLLVVVWAAEFRAPISGCCDLIFVETSKGRMNGWEGGRAELAILQVGSVSKDPESG